MSGGEVVERLTAAEGSIDLFRLRNGTLWEDEMASFGPATSKISGAPIFIEDQAGLNILELCAKARRLKSKHGIKLMIVDYLQLVKGFGRRKEESKTDEVTDVSRTLKQLAKELGIPIVALSQVDDAGKVKWARAIAEDANTLIFIEHRGQEGSFLRIDKQRNGPRGIDIPVKFEKQFVRFTSRPKPMKPLL
jgi:replicative DNA helicase